MLRLPLFANLRAIPIVVSAAFFLVIESPIAAERVDPTTLTGKLIMGYQGWFACPGDAAGRGWVHWQSGKAYTVDMLPDVAELAPAERCETDLTSKDGRKIEVFSSQNAATVDRHFEWMAQYGLDGVAVQRFWSVLPDPKIEAGADHVLANVQHAAEAQGRVFFLMYDLSGATSDRLDLVREDWRRLETQGLTESPSYLHHRGHPVLGIWGLGFAGRPITPQAAQGFLKALAETSQSFGGLTILGGVPVYWRSGAGDASDDPAWNDVWPMLQIISPWTVGRYADAASADTYRRQTLEPDLAAARHMGADYMPVVFPGFTWANLMRAGQQPSKAIANQIPRRCGRFYWRQIYNAVSAGATMIYGAMFDEVDEGTAMFKILASAHQSPDAFVTLDADGCALPSDWYLRLAGKATEVLRGRTGIMSELPLWVPEK